MNGQALQFSGLTNGMEKTTLKRLEIIHEDGSCIVLNKPTGLAVQGGKGVAVSLDNILADAWGQRPFLVHRLDKDTSGLILVAKTKIAAADFSKLFEKNGGDKSITKLYLAVCKGRPDSAEGVISIDLDIRQSVKKSKTHFRLLQEYSAGEFSLLELELGTGRMHQIRRHLALSGTPILGDDKYGDFKLNRRLRKEIKLRRLLLHAWRLIIPETRETAPLDLTAPVSFMMNF